MQTQGRVSPHPSILFLTHTYTHTHESRAHSPPWPMPPTAVAPARSDQNSLLSACPSVRPSSGEDTEFSPSSLRPGACCPSELTKAGFCSSPLPLGTGTFRTAALAPSPWPPDAGGTTPCRALAGPRHVLGGQGHREVFLGLPGAMAGGGWRPVAGQKEEEGPAPPPMRHHFYSLGLQGVLGAFVFLFFFLKKK